MIVFYNLKELLDEQFKGSGNIVIYGFDYRIKKFCRELQNETGFKIKTQKEILVISKNIIKDISHMKRTLNRYRFRYEIY